MAKAWRAWTDSDLARLDRDLAAGRSYAEIGDAEGRTENAVRVKAGERRRARGAAASGTDSPPPATPDAREWSERSDGSADLALTTDRAIKTLAELVDVCEIDVDTWDVVEWKAKAWQASAKVGEGDAARLTARTLYAVTARLRRREGLSTQQAVAAMVDGAVAARGARHPGRARAFPASDLLQCVLIADPHFAKYAWNGGTGHGDYDLKIARTELLRGAGFLLGAGAQRGVTARCVAFLGDYFHYDTPSGTTTGGTALDRDSRMQHMLEVGVQTACEIVAESAETAHTDVVLVPGNHDEALTWALQRILASEFRSHRQVTVRMDYTRRQYLAWGRNLLGFNHGDKRKKELAASMAIERPAEWGASVYREIHTGHLHSEGERYEGTLTHAGVIVRTHRSIAPADAWHADEQYVGAPRGMSGWLYHRDGGLVGCDVADPRLLTPAAAA